MFNLNWLLLAHVHEKASFWSKILLQKVETGFLMIESQARLPLAPSPSTNRPDLTDEYHIFMLTHIAIIHQL